MLLEKHGTSSIPTPKRSHNPDSSTLPPTVWLLDQPECPAYERFVQEHPRGSFYHHLVWRDVLTNLGIGTPYYLLALRGNRLCGVLPMFQTVGPDKQLRLVSLPGTPTAGPLTIDDTSHTFLLSRALKLAERQNASGVYLRSLYRGSAPVLPPNTEFIRLSVSSILNSEMPASMPPEKPGYPPLPLNHIAASRPLLARHGHYLHSYKTPDTNVMPGRISWLLADRVAHVLSWSFDPWQARAGWRLLQHVAIQCCTNGVEYIVFPAPPWPRGWLRHLDLVTPYLFSQSQPLSAPGSVSSPSIGSQPTSGNSD
ncbi:MAG: hypothetical protein ABIG44_10200 [Planctomycetota bacterium]